MVSNKDIKIDVLYEDADCVVLNKPANLMVHGDGKASGPFLTDWILEHYPQTRGVGETLTSVDGEVLERPGIVHRLDRDTTGAIIIAKTATGHTSLKQQFQAHEIAKKYVAIVWGNVKENFGTIRLPIGRSISDFRKWSAEKTIRGEAREAETYWTLVGRKTFGTGPDTQHFSVIVAEPKTGRTHQIRVHMKALQHPVVGDALYGSHMPPALGFTRLALHSWKVDFTNTAGKKVDITAPFPEDFEAAFKQLEIDPAAIY